MEQIPLFKPEFEFAHHENARCDATRLACLEARQDATRWSNAINLANIGLKAYSITAWGNAPGIETRQYLRAESPLY